MCDTILAPPSTTAAGGMLFGKNSDRQRNEAQAVEHVSAADHAPDSALKCTYITIAQAPHTFATMLCRPFWTWGAEMGANEHGVVIGNEGLHSRAPAPRDEALIGMDLLRLALERASSAAQAVELITTLLERHGQGGNCGHLTPSYYNNSFIVADAREAFVLETVFRDWLVERVNGIRALSNGYSIGRGPMRVSAGLRQLLLDSGWSTESEPNFAEAIQDPEREHLGNARGRRACSTALLAAHKGQIAAAEMMRVLREHGTPEHPDQQWRADCTIERTVCMHAGADDRPAQTVGSLVSELHAGDAVHWVTGTSAPCTSIFKPVLLDVPLLLVEPAPTDRFDPRTLWWRHELLHRAALRDDFARFLEEIRPERDALEAQFAVRVKAVLNGGDRADRSRMVAQCWQQAAAAEDRWFNRVQARSHSSSDPAWQRLNQLAGMTAEG
jgi:secernin